jgi:hypothetical protein
MCCFSARGESMRGFAPQGNTTPYLIVHSLRRKHTMSLTNKENNASSISVTVCEGPLGRSSGYCQGQLSPQSTWSGLSFCHGSEAQATNTPRAPSCVRLGEEQCPRDAQMRCINWAQADGCGEYPSFPALCAMWVNWALCHRHACQHPFPPRAA